VRGLALRLAPAGLPELNLVQPLAVGVVQGFGQGLPLTAPEPAPHPARGTGRIGGDPLQLGDDHRHRLVVVDRREPLAPVRDAGEVGAGGLLQALPARLAVELIADKWTVAVLAGLSRARCAMAS